MAVRTFTANFVGRTDNLEKSFKRVSKGSALMSDNLMKATRMAGIGLGALAGVAFGAWSALKPMLDKAGSFEEALSKNQLLLGESSKAAEAFAETATDSFGISELAALQATGVFASLGDAMGMSEEASASMATSLTGLAGGLSSMHDVDVETALTALRAGLIGEAEPLRKLGILLDAATIKNQALAMGLIENTKEALTPAIKSQAAYALIMEKGAVAMDDYTRTADSATNVSKRLGAEWENLQVQIGTIFLPGFTAIITHLADKVMPALEEFFDDPSWPAMGKLSAEALTSEFVKTASGVFLTVSSWLTNPVGNAIALGAGELRKLAVGAGTDFGTAFSLGVEQAINEGGRLNPDWYRGDWDPAASGTADGTTYGAAVAAAVAGGVIPGPLIPAAPTGPWGSGASGSGRVPGGFEVVPPPVVPPAGPNTGGPPGFTQVNPNTLLNAEQALRLLSDPTSDLSAFTQPRQTGPPGTPITINVTGVVSGNEVIEAIGGYVDTNGPLPPHWQQGAN